MSEENPFPEQRAFAEARKAICHECPRFLHEGKSMVLCGWVHPHWESCIMGTCPCEKWGVDSYGSKVEASS
jgi:hypothetical protein